MDKQDSDGQIYDADARGDAAQDEAYLDEVDAEAAKPAPDTESVWATLSRPVPPALIKQRTAPGGFKPSYVPWAVTWKLLKAKYPQASYEVLFAGEMNGGAYVAVRITIDGNVGDGVGWEPFNSPTNLNRETGEILRDEKNQLREDQRTDCGLMAAESTALKRAAGKHGLAIDLWIKESLQEGVNRVIDKVQPAGQETAKRSAFAQPDDTGRGPAPNCPLHRKLMRYFPAKGNLKAVWKCTVKADDGTYCNQRVEMEAAQPEPESSPEPSNGVPVTIQKYRDEATAKFPELLDWDNEQLTARITAGEAFLVENGIAGYGTDDTTEFRRGAYLDQIPLEDARVDTLRGYYAYLKSSAKGTE